VTNFVGEYKCKLDAKGRLRIPSDLKAQMSPEADGKFVINRGIGGCLEMYPSNYWKVVRAQLTRKLNKFNPKHLAFMRQFMAGAKEMALDSADRVNFPKHLLDMMGLKGEVYLVASLSNTIEVWAADKWEAQIENFDPQDYEGLAGDVMGDINLDDEQ